MKPITIGAVALLVSATCQAAMADEEKQPKEAVLKDVVVSATRTEQDINDVANTITTISADRIDKEMPTDIEDLVRYETGVSVRAQPNRSSAVFRSTGRGGNEGINVRGLEGDQVLLQVDGVRLPSSFSSGPFSAGRGDYIDVEAYKRVEILRGPSSTQFGSDGLSGAVSFVTKDPVDLLTLGKPVQTASKLGYSSADRSWQFAPSFAFRNETVQGMVLASLRRGHETETMGTNDAADVSRTTPNPASNRSDFVMAKLLLAPETGHEFKLTLESLDRKNTTDVLSFFGDPYTVSTLTDVDVREDITRTLYKLDYRYTQPDNPLYQIATASLYHQDSNNHQFGYEARSTNPLVRTRDTEYGEKTTGGHVQFESNLGEALTQRVVYGVDASLTKVTSLKEGYNSSGTAFVTNKSFPDTDYQLLGAFIQDEFGLGNISLIPGLRYDSFKLTPKPDALYAVNNTASASTLKGNELSPKLGAIWKFDPAANVFAQYAHGFRAPKPSQVNGGVTNLTVTTGTGPYTSIGNPNLKPETSDTFELGLRGNSDTIRYSVSVFRSKYKNFIASNVMIESNDAPTPDVLQTINLNEARISGYEARGDWAFLRDWTASASYSHTSGESITEGVSTPLDTIDPNKLVLGLRFDDKGSYGGQAMLTSVSAKDSNPNPENYVPKAYQIVDLSGWYHFDRQTSLNAAVYNLFNRKYVQWADVRDVAATTTTIDAYSQPGRNFSLSVKHQF